MKKLTFLLCILVFSVTVPVYSQNVIEVSIQPIRDVKWSSDGEYLAVGQHQGGLAIYDRQLNLLSHIYPQDTISSVSWSPNNTQLAVEHLRQLEILSWDKNTLTLTFEQVFNFTNPVLFVSWNPVNNWVVVAEDKDNLLCLSMGCANR
jgi:WD40 repeat protein